MQVTLTQQGYDVRTATSAYEALDILATGDPQLLILDLMMPLVSGWDILTIRAADVVTATDAFDIRRVCLAAQAIRSADRATNSRRFRAARLRGTKPRSRMNDQRHRSRSSRVSVAPTPPTAHARTLVRNSLYSTSVP